MHPMLSKTVEVTVDRPLGSHPPDFPNLIYPVNYGYVQGILALDGEEQDVYVLGVDRPVEQFTGKVIGIVHRKNDVEDKWVVAPDGISFNREEIFALTHFQEQYFTIEIETIK